MCGRGPAPPVIQVLGVLGYAHCVLTDGCELVAGLFFAAVAAVVAFSTTESVGPAVGAKIVL